MDFSCTSGIWDKPANLFAFEKYTSSVNFKLNPKFLIYMSSGCFIISFLFYIFLNIALGKPSRKNRCGFGFPPEHLSEKNPLTRNSRACPGTGSWGRPSACAGSRSLSAAGIFPGRRSPRSWTTCREFPKPKTIRSWRLFSDLLAKVVSSKICCLRICRLICFLRVDQF